ncbi:MAG: translation initiation factor IF-2 [Chloroflexi bacterium]|nr:translation initiation factor IF-2 [Chloroflexota bacterium]
MAFGRARRRLPGQQQLRTRTGRRGPVAEAPASVAIVQSRVVELPASITVRDLAGRLRVNPAEIIRSLLASSIAATINQTIDRETATLAARALEFEIEEAPQVPEKEGALPTWRQAGEEGAKLVSRPSVVTVMGHVDHGKTSLLDAIRRTNVTATEAGGITQHIGAYQVEVHGKRITFLDTPGHEAFTAMRARGAQATDIAVIVVAADDGVMPQTREAIDHARAAQVPIVVAINKIDKPEANVDRVKQQLSELGLNPEEWGGDTVVVPISARQGVGIDNLLEMILLVAELAELKADMSRHGTGVVLEARRDKTLGPVASILVQHGLIKVGDYLSAGSTYGRVRALRNDRGKRVMRAEPATPVEVIGLAEVPQAGDLVRVVESDRTARILATEAEEQARLTASQPRQVATLEELSREVEAGEMKELNLILKTDVDGSIEPIRDSLERLSDERVKVRVIHAGTGSVNDSDVLLAVASKAIIIGFNTRVEPSAKAAAEDSRVDIRTYGVIYEVVDDMQHALRGIAGPVYREQWEGRAMVKEVFRMSKGRIVLGSVVVDGKVRRGALARILRDGQVVYEGRITSLRRFKEDAREVASGLECGIGVENFSEPQGGDMLECYSREEVS